MHPGLPAISWIASGYTTSDAWLGLVVNGCMLGVPALLFVGSAWWVFKSGPQPGRDAALTWVMLGASALCAGAAYPSNPELLIPSLGAAALAAGCSWRVRRKGSEVLLGVSLIAWVVWLPACLVLAIALR